MPFKIPDIVITVPCKLETFFKGGELHAKYERLSVCPNCSGISVCIVCGGTGKKYVIEDKKVQEQPCDAHQSLDNCELCGGRPLCEVMTLNMVIKPFTPPNSFKTAGKGHIFMGQTGEINCTFDVAIPENVKLKARVGGYDVIIYQEIGFMESIYSMDYSLDFMGEKITVKHPPPICCNNRHMIKGHGLGENNDLIIKYKIKPFELGRNNADAIQRAMVAK